MSNKKIKKERKVNIIKALKEENKYYKKQPTNVVYQTLDYLNHFRLQSMVRHEEVLHLSEDIILELLSEKLVKSFKDSIKYLPVETEYDEKNMTFRSCLDIWIK